MRNRRGLALATRCTNTTWCGKRSTLAEVRVAALSMSGSSAASSASHSRSRASGVKGRRPEMTRSVQVSASRRTSAGTWRSPRARKKTRTNPVGSTPTTTPSPSSGWATFRPGCRSRYPWDIVSKRDPLARLSVVAYQSGDIHRGAAVPQRVGKTHPLPVSPEEQHLLLGSCDLERLL
ncbi:hypothetical protein DBT_0427 [Dissulfuribacter thermophilus]|uniref:Uncharacterized protein n=1 Tax=Dissulfuribacter thermophilus TaxID=1156395 RepID=A0A1B9F830_9BACT|nr:hypothetical protein DBT_0427 [Dissulfuribacter thermophilus]